MMESTKRHTILIIDDLPQNLMVLESMLSREDRRIITCLSGAEALQILLKEKVSLILVDVQMPEMDGFEFVEIIKNHPSTATIPTVFVTAISNDPIFLNKAYELGALDFLFKPLNVDVTRKKVESFLKIWDHDQELKELNEKLVEKNSELEQFSHILAHDLKTPVGNIISLLNIIKIEYSDQINSEMLNLFDMIETSATGMSRLIEDLLHYTKNVYNKEGKELINLQQTVENVINLINPPQKVKIDKINLNHQVWFQPMAINQMLLNLISNAIKYNDKETPEIKVFYNSERNTLSVKDNGPGINEKLHNKAFEMFQTLGNNSNGESSTGIGLNLVKKLAEKNDVEVKIISDGFEGCEFVISNLVNQ